MNGGRKDSGPGPETPFTARSRSYSKPNDTAAAGVTFRTTNTMSGDWLTVDGVAEALGIPPRHVDSLIHGGELDAERCPVGLCGYHISEEALEAYIAQRLPAAILTGPA